MTRRDDYKAAVVAGRAAQIGDANPYSGQGILADLWRSGYLRMLEQWLSDAPARQAALRKAADPNQSA